MSSFFIMKQIIIACPGSASTSLKSVINKYSNYRCIQIINYDHMDHNKSFLRSAIKNLTKLKLGNFFQDLHKYSFYKFYDNLIINKLRNTNPTTEYKYLRQHHSDICDFDIHLYHKLCDFLKLNPNTICKQHFPPTEFNKQYLKDFKKIILIRNTEKILNKYKNITSGFYKQLEPGLKKELNKWKSGWINEPNTLVINFENLVNNPIEELNNIELFSDIKFDIDDTFKLDWENKSI